MTEPGTDDPRHRPKPVGIELEPTIASRIARWTERARILRERTEAARSRHSSVDLGYRLVERDSGIGGGLLAGALAYRLFVLLLPTSLLLVSGLGIYAGTVNESPGTVVRKAGLHGLIASQIASTASSQARWIVFLAMVPAVLYATAKLCRALAIVHAIVWEGSGRGTHITPRGVGLVGATFLLSFIAAAIVGWARHHGQLGGLAAQLGYVALMGGAWLVASMELPHRDVRWRALLPGAALFGAGLLLVNVFNVYVTTRLVEGRANTYGALGIAAGLLFSLVLVGRVMVVSAELNAALDERHNRTDPS
jgi:membrane protein